MPAILMHDMENRKSSLIKEAQGLSGKQVLLDTSYTCER